MKRIVHWLVVASLAACAPADRALILQKALQETVKDPEFIAEADKAKIGLAPVTVDEMKKTVDGVFKLDPGLLAKLKNILF
jgi:hypothetical protein